MVGRKMRSLVQLNLLFYYRSNLEQIFQNGMILTLLLFAGS